MFKSFVAALAAVAYANEPELILSDRLANTIAENRTPIEQVAGMENFTLTEDGTYADPDPIQKGITQMFYLNGVWLIDGSANLDKLVFQCYIAGAKVFNEEYQCDGTGNDEGHCPRPAEGVGAVWNANFGFDVPAFAPPGIEY